MLRSFLAHSVLLARRLLGPTAALAAAMASWSCGRTIEEEEPRELVEHRIEPCRKWCSAQHSPECGRVDEPQPFESAEECTEDCAALDTVYGWDWARQADGTDTCAAEWVVMADCMDALTCEEQRAFFRRLGTSDEYPCKVEISAKQDCFYSTPSLERTDD